MTTWPEATCAIHQPNFFPRLSTLAKLYTADHWIVLDDVQANARDYQHRARLADLNPTSTQWLSLPVHRPHGQASRITDIEVVDRHLCRRRTIGMVTQFYARSRHWSALRHAVEQVADAIDATRSMAVIATVSTLALLRLVGWSGAVHHSSDLASRSHRSARLADLTRSVGATRYLCGPGGGRYLDTAPFHQLGIGVDHFDSPSAPAAWTQARSLSALWALATVGPRQLREDLEAMRTKVPGSGRHLVGSAENTRQ
ncbi:WbqC family protein [Longispora sp. NPDC051575]|uniref:WbqC family protein n=1 Tax=Longispora sp. NPDC051575 TaxID=3154943 RepID=UPI003412E68E